MRKGSPGSIALAGVVLFAFSWLMWREWYGPGVHTGVGRLLGCTACLGAAAGVAYLFTRAAAAIAMLPLAGDGGFMLGYLTNNPHRSDVAFTVVGVVVAVGVGLVLAVLLSLAELTLRISSRPTR